MPWVNFKVGPLDYWYVSTNGSWFIGNNQKIKEPHGKQYNTWFGNVNQNVFRAFISYKQPLIKQTT